MKKLLLGSSALLGAAAIATPVSAEEPIKLGVGGFFKTAYMVVIDDDGEDELGGQSNTDGFFSDSEIFFTGSTVLDNGLEVGARVELEGETDDDQIDEAWIWFSGGFGEVRVGSDDDALANTCIVPPGGTGNFSAFSPNQWGANSAMIGALTIGEGVFSSNSVCTGVDSASDAQKLIYISPVFGGFQITGSYTPDETAENHTNDGGPHLGMPGHAPFESRHNFSVYGTYNYEADGWGLTAGLGGSWEGHVEEGDTDVDFEEQDFYQAGINLSVGNFSIGVVGEYFNDFYSGRDDFQDIDVDVWVAGIGAAYQMDTWTFGLQYSHRENDNDVDIFGSPFEDFTSEQDRVVATVNYVMGPGVSVDGQIGYTWVDTDPEIENALPGTPEGLDDYDGFEIAIGTNFTF